MWLSYHGIGVIVETEGENKIEWINDGKSYDFLYLDCYGASYCCSFRADSSFAGYKNYKTNELEKKLSPVIAGYEKAKTKDYFSSTKSLAVKLAKDIQKISEHTEMSDVMFCREFTSQYPEISKMDVRFNDFFILDVDNFYIFRPIFDVDYETYLERLDEVYNRMKNGIINTFNKQLEDIKSYYNKIYSLIKENLSKGKRVGLINILGQMDSRGISFDTKSLEQFDIDDYLTSEWDTLYWFTK